MLGHLPARRARLPHAAATPPRSRRRPAKPKPARGEDLGPCPGSGRARATTGRCSTSATSRCPPTPRCRQPDHGHAALGRLGLRQPDRRQHQHPAAVRLPPRRPRPPTRPAADPAPAIGDHEPPDCLYAALQSLLLRGNCYGQIVDRAGAGLLPTQVELLAPDRVAVNVPNGSIEYRVDGQEVDPASIWHVKAYTSAGSVVGLSPIAHARQAIGLGLAAEKYGASSSASRPSPPGCSPPTSASPARTPPTSRNGGRPPTAAAATSPCSATAPASRPSASSPKKPVPGDDPRQRRHHRPLLRRPARADRRRERRQPHLRQRRAARPRLPPVRPRALAGPHGDRPVGPALLHHDRSSSTPPRWSGPTCSPATRPTRAPSGPAGSSAARSATWKTSRPSPASTTPNPTRSRRRMIHVRSSPAPSPSATAATAAPSSAPSSPGASRPAWSTGAGWSPRRSSAAPCWGPTPPGCPSPPPTPATPAPSPSASPSSLRTAPTPPAAPGGLGHPARRRGPGPRPRRRTPRPVHRVRRGGRREPLVRRPPAGHPDQGRPRPRRRRPGTRLPRSARRGVGSCVPAERMAPSSPSSAAMGKSRRRLVRSATSKADAAGAAPGSSDPATAAHHAPASSGSRPPSAGASGDPHPAPPLPRLRQTGTRQAQVQGLPRPHRPGQAGTTPRPPQRRRRTRATAPRSSPTTAPWSATGAQGGNANPAHPSADLTADHVMRSSSRGLPTGPLVVRCRSCNAERAPPTRPPSSDKVEAPRPLASRSRHHTPPTTPPVVA